MKTVIVPAPGKIEIRQVETPVINAYQALVKTDSRKIPRSGYLSIGFGA